MDALAHRMSRIAGEREREGFVSFCFFVSLCSSSEAPLLIGLQTYTLCVVLKKERCIICSAMGEANSGSISSIC